MARTHDNELINIFLVIFQVNFRFRKYTASISTSQNISQNNIKAIIDY